MAQVKIVEKGPSKLKVTFPYNPTYVEKTKEFKGSRWHSKGKYRSIPYSEGVIEKLLSIFDGEKIDVDPSLQVPNFEDIKRERVNLEEVGEPQLGKHTAEIRYVEPEFKRLMVM